MSGKRKQRYAVRDLVDALQGLQDLVNMPVSAMTDDMAFRLARAMRQVKPEVEVYERRRIALMRELGTVTAQDGKSEILDPAKQDEYEERLAALLDRELSLNLEPIPWASAKAAIPGLRLGHLALCHVLFVQARDYDELRAELVDEGRLDAAPEAEA